MSFESIVSVNAISNDTGSYNKEFGFKVLLTGSGWYRGVPKGHPNPAMCVVEALDGKLIGGARVRGKIDFDLWGSMVREIITAVEYFDPDIVISLGQHADKFGLVIEEYGCNTAYGEDNDGFLKGYEDINGNKVYEKIDYDGPDWYRSTLSAEKVINYVLDQGIPAYKGNKVLREASFIDPTGIVKEEKAWFSSAGSYLCNWVAYGVPHMAKKRGLNFKFAFVHIPTTPDYRAIWMQDGGAPGPSMEIDRIIHGVRAMIEGAVIEATNNRVWHTKDRPLN